MNPKDTFKDNSSHSIEWGEATWDNSEFSIRNRYDNPKTGKFNYAGSAEIPWEDFKMMIEQSITRGHFTEPELIEILKEIAKKL
ncbi:hypothetical protein E0W68_03995 [Flavobacterium salilacus subsp. salilacus]|uniref:hypothetical protein n=1 Tax=Flavobacterium TaxID=237 RepID=UPI001075643B|nr:MULTISPECIES: hypothetical protein [Flavobacterium]KAF2519518.1 hypothetical protein E0W68_03995 [Flavobacterium salilacus subsp. salilacus]MBE1614584.1 hypothetical protein [Flavobacterium sp. SaA2.13]